MRTNEVQALLFEKYGVFADCSNLSDYQVSRFLDIYPRPQISKFPTIGKLFDAMFGRGVRLPVAMVNYELLSAQTKVVSAQCPSFYSELVRSLRVHREKSDAQLEAFKKQSLTALHAIKRTHEAELLVAENNGYQRGVRETEKLYRKRLLAEARGAYAEISESLCDYTPGIRDDLDECLKALEKNAGAPTSGAYDLIIDISKKFAKRAKFFSGRKLVAH